MRLATGDLYGRTKATRRSRFSRDPLETITRTNLYYIDYYEKNAVFMERARELRELIPGLIAARQRVNREWAARIMSHVRRYRAEPLQESALRLRVIALECMIDDVMRELFVIQNPDMIAVAQDRASFARELSTIWFRALYLSEGPQTQCHPDPWEKADFAKRS